MHAFPLNVTMTNHEKDVTDRRHRADTDISLQWNEAYSRMRTDLVWVKASIDSAPISRP
jgi:hypothetical protein